MLLIRESEGILLVFGLALAPFEVERAQFGIGRIGLMQGVALFKLDAGEALLDFVLNAVGYEPLHEVGRHHHHAVGVAQEHVAG